MDDVIISAVGIATDAGVEDARLGQRFGRLDLASKLALLAVEVMAAEFETMARERIGFCLTARAGSLTTDVEYWSGRTGTGGPSPTLFAYTLPSAAIGELAIRHRLLGPNLCLVGGSDTVVNEGEQMILRGEADGCVCVSVQAVSEAAGGVIGEAPISRAVALFLRRGGSGLTLAGQNDRDIEALCGIFVARKSVS